MKIASFLLSFLALAVAQTAIAQNQISFAYDAAGNRVSRQIVLPRSMPSDPLQETDENAFFDMLAQRTVKLVGTASGILKIEIIGFEPADDVQAEVFTTDGRLVVSQKISEATASIDISSRATGTYILIISVNGQQTTWKVAKQ